MQTHEPSDTVWLSCGRVLFSPSLYIKDLKKDNKTLKPKAASSYRGNAKQEMHATCKHMRLVTQCGFPVEVSCPAPLYAFQGPQERQTGFEESGLGDGK